MPNHQHPAFILPRWFHCCGIALVQQIYRMISPVQQSLQLFVA